MLQTFSCSLNEYSEETAKLFRKFEQIERNSLETKTIAMYQEANFLESYLRGNSEHICIGRHSGEKMNDGEQIPLLY